MPCLGLFAELMFCFRFHKVGPDAFVAYLVSIGFCFDFNPFYLGGEGWVRFFEGVKDMTAQLHLGEIIELHPHFTEVAEFGVES